MYRAHLEEFEQENAAPVGIILCSGLIGMLGWCVNSCNVV